MVNSTTREPLVVMVMVLLPTTRATELTVENAKQNAAKVFMTDDVEAALLLQ